jgi:hypothetical protein
MSAFTRRAVLMAGGALTVLSAVVGRRAESAQKPSLPSQLQPLLWLDASLPPSTRRPDALLGPELVGQWRSHLLPQLRLRGEAVTALVRWDKAMMLAGLAREEGWTTRTHRLGQGVFRVDVSV